MVHCHEYQCLQFVVKMSPTFKVLWERFERKQHKLLPNCDFSSKVPWMSSVIT